MINADNLRELVLTYEKYGWTLRRIVTTGGRCDEAFQVPLAVGVVDAAWFSRPSPNGPVAWEIRYLGPTQYALVEHLDENAQDFEQKLHHAEQRLSDAVSAKRNA